MPLSRMNTVDFAADSSGADVEKTYSRVTWRLLPFLFLCYVAAYLDRVNIGFAKFQMSADLHFSETTYGAGAGIFFFGYFLFEVPSNVLLARFGARRWLARIMVTWGLISGATLFVSSAHSFYLLRFLLGLAEAGLFPGVILYLTYWFPSHRRARIVALFMTAQPVAGILGSPLSGWILQAFSGKHAGLANWQWLFLIEALPSIFLGIAMLFYLDDGFPGAKWLSETEKRHLGDAIALDAVRKEEHSILGALLDKRVLLLSVIYFCFVMGLYGVGFWMPTMLKTAGVQTPLAIGFLTAVPSCVAIVAMLLVSHSADRRHERRWHLFITAACASASLFFVTALHSSLPTFVVALSITTAGIVTSLPLFWSLPTAFLGGKGASSGIALINSLGNLAGFVSPYLVGIIKDATGSTNLAMYVIAAAMLLGATLVFRMPSRLVDV